MEKDLTVCLEYVHNYFSKYKRNRKTTFYRVRRSKGLGSSGIFCAGSNASGR